MLALLKSKRPARPGNGVRSFLRLEELDSRAMPDGGVGDPPPTDPPYVMPPPVSPAPNIDTFDASEVAHGWWKITGHVTFANPNGLVIRFDGIPALANRTATADADGNFVLVFEVQTNGNDVGTISAQTAAPDGTASNIALAYVSPTR